jgi:hypothetical protein
MRHDPTLSQTQPYLPPFIVGIMYETTLSQTRPYFYTLNEVMWGAWTDYHGPKYRKVALHHSRTTRPSIIRDHMVARARNIPLSNPEFSIIDKSNGFFALALGSSFIFQFRKLNNSLYTAPRSTNQYELFVNHLPIDETPPTALHLTIGYIPNESWTSFDGPFIICPKGRRRYHWYIDIAQELRTPTITIPTPPALPQRRSRVRGKQPRVHSREENKTEKEQSDDSSS